MITMTMMKMLKTMLTLMLTSRRMGEDDRDDDCDGIGDNDDDEDDDDRDDDCDGDDDNDDDDDDGGDDDVTVVVDAAAAVQKGVESTGLGQRIANMFVRSFGSSSLGLAYSLVGAGVSRPPFLHFWDFINSPRSLMMTSIQFVL